MFSFAVQLHIFHCIDSEINVGRVTNEAGDVEAFSVHFS